MKKWFLAKKVAEYENLKHEIQVLKAEIGDQKLSSMKVH